MFCASLQDVRMFSFFLALGTSIVDAVVFYDLDGRLYYLNLPADILLTYLFKRCSTDIADAIVLGHVEIYLLYWKVCKLILKG